MSASAQPRTGASPREIQIAMAFSATASVCSPRIRRRLVNDCSGHRLNYGRIVCQTYAQTKPSPYQPKSKTHQMFCRRDPATIVPKNWVGLFGPTRLSSVSTRSKTDFTSSAARCCSWRPIKVRWIDASPSCQLISPGFGCPWLLGMAISTFFRRSS